MVGLSHGPVLEVINWSIRPFLASGLDPPKDAEPCPTMAVWDLG